MFQVKPYQGTPEKLSEFIIAVWQSTYAGTMAVPHWSGDYFRWQLRLDEADAVDRAVCVYDGDQLAGAMMHFPMKFQIGGEFVEGAQASWLSVPVAYRGKGIANMLSEGTRELLRTQAREFKLGFAYYGSNKSLGLKFWKKTQGKSVSFGNRVGFWVRVLDPAKAAAWNVNSWEGRLTAFSSLFLQLPRRRETQSLLIRPIQPNDLPRCLQLAEFAARHCELRLIWDEDSLSRQLGINGFSEALVAEEHGELRGCIGYHVLPIYGKTLENVGVIDLVLTSELSAKARSELLNTALLRLRTLGSVVALKLRTGDYPTGTFLRWGWFWKPADSQVIITWADEIQQLPPVKRLHVLWR
ncbi:MAG: GNAT family N-acetyltransferase [Planctomycetota bacterium]|nr:GNAT family N-acetyltransferase [Planctomycetota bacterium]